MKYTVKVFRGQKLLNSMSGADWLATCAVFKEVNLNEAETGAWMNGLTGARYEDAHDAIYETVSDWNSSESGKNTGLRALVDAL